jgi:putative flippase GtrA
MRTYAKSATGTATSGLTITVSRTIGAAWPRHAPPSSPRGRNLGGGRYGPGRIAKTGPAGDDSDRGHGQPDAMGAPVAQRRVRASTGPPVLGQWVRFVVVGGSNTVLSWCAYAVMTHLGLAYAVASALAFALGALNSYALNRRWTFRSHQRPAKELLRFGVVQAVGLALDLSLLYLLTHDAGVHHLIAQALVFPAASAATFVLSRRWVFARAARVR